MECPRGINIMITYDSFAIIDNVKKSEFLSKEEIVQNRQGIVYNPELNTHKSRKQKKIEKTKK